VILHEWAHYLHAAISRDDSPGSDHPPGSLLDPSTAFSEGFATAFAGMVRKSVSGTPDYVDTSGPGQTAGGASVEEDNVDDEALVFADANLLYDGFYSEASVAEVIYDLFDAFDLADLNSGEPTADLVSLGFKPIYNALAASRNTPAFTSLFSFLKELKQANPSVAAKIDTLTEAENIGSGDEYSATGLSLYSTLQIGVTSNTGSDDFFNGKPLRTQALFGPITTGDSGNKLWNRVLFRFAVPVRGCFAVQAGTGTAQFLTLELNLRDVSTNATSLTRLVRFFEAGDYSVRVSAESAIQFNIRLEELQLDEAHCHP
jgi:hypothetical protein